MYAIDFEDVYDFDVGFCPFCWSEGPLIGLRVWARSGRHPPAQLPIYVDSRRHRARRRHQPRRGGAAAGRGTTRHVRPTWRRPNCRNTGGLRARPRGTGHPRPGASRGGAGEFGSGWRNSPAAPGGGGGIRTGIWMDTVRVELTRFGWDQGWDAIDYDRSYDTRFGRDQGWDAVEYDMVTMRTLS